MNPTHRPADESDLDLLAEWNHQLIRDEGHRNQMTVPELRQRMQSWLASDYTAMLFQVDGEPVAYGLYRETENEVYLRQFFVRRDQRRSGLGRKAMALFFQQIWPQNKRLTVEVLTNNEAGVQFWRSIGYADYSLTLEIKPKHHDQYTRDEANAKDLEIIERRADYLNQEAQDVISFQQLP